MASASGFLWKDESRSRKSWKRERGRKHRPGHRGKAAHFGAGLARANVGSFPAHPLAEPTTHRLRMFMLIIAKIFVSLRDGLQVRPGPEASAADRGALARKRREGPTPITRSVIKSSESSSPTKRRGAGNAPGVETMHRLVGSAPRLEKSRSSSALHPRRGKQARNTKSVCAQYSSSIFVDMAQRSRFARKPTNTPDSTRESRKYWPR